MAQFPWRPNRQLEPARSYVVMASQLPLKRYGSIPRFMRDTLTVRRQLRTAPGLVGYALLAEMTRKTFWTFSVWEDRASLELFATSDPHARIIQGLRPKMEKTSFTFVDVDGSELPWRWDEVRARLTTDS
jgi:heme-degrading monooxygenase HmoA